MLIFCRYQHLLVRNSSESISFFRAAKFERSKSNKLLKQLLICIFHLCNWKLVLDSAVNIFDYFGSILSYLVIAVPILRGDYDNLNPADLSSLISKNSFVCMYLIYNFSQLIDMTSSITQIATHTHRLVFVRENPPK